MLDVTVFFVCPRGSENAVQGAAGIARLVVLFVLSLILQRDSFFFAKVSSGICGRNF